jgi:ComF family protein
MIDELLGLIAPHYCSGCGERGSILCDNCKYDIISEPYNACVNCQKTVVSRQGICTKCKVAYGRAWCVADRRDQLEQLINRFKFENARAAYSPLAQLLHEHLPELPVETVIVPIPTIQAHIRGRGYDHMLLVARQFAKLRGLPVSSVLQRATSTRQRDASRKQRIAQAKEAFACKQQLDARATYLLIDDVVTTGATMHHAAQKLRDAGAGVVWVATISHQPLD